MAGARAWAAGGDAESPLQHHAAQEHGCAERSARSGGGAFVVLDALAVAVDVQRPDL